jgi:serine/threonine protein kinase
VSEASEHTQFGKYQIIERIASGGMAEVFKARMEGLGGFQRLFAIKRIIPQHSKNKEFVEMLVEEAKIAGLLSHANIVQIVDLGQVDDSYYIAMEYVDGPNLEFLLERVRTRQGLIPIPHAVFICLEILKALEYAHNRQVMRGGRPVPLDIIHRDICPANILLGLRGEVKLTDFGIAKASVRSIDTITGIVKGRFDYLSPEQARGEDASQLCDIFNVGILLYQMLTGRHPFKQASEPKTLDAIKRASYVPAVAFNPEVPPAIDRLIGQTLTKEAGERFASATAMKEALDRFFHEAGYIFSHATLAAYLKGLCPELVEVHRQQDNDGGNEDQETRPFLRGERPVSAVAGRVDTEEMPTAERIKTPSEMLAAEHRPSAPTQSGVSRIEGLLAGTKPATPSSGPLTSLETSMSGVFGPVNDENTIIGRNKANVPEWAELDTVIRPVIKTPSRGSDFVDDVPTRAQSNPVSSVKRRAKASPAEPRARRNNNNNNPRVRRFQILSLTIGVIIVMAALTMGFFLGHRAGRLTSGGASAISVPSDPRLEVHLPEGALLAIDGREVTGTSPIVVPLIPDKSHVVRITKAGHFPVETVIKLRKNDVRLLTIETAELHKKRP